MPSFGLAALMPKKIPFRRYHMGSAGFAKTRVRDEVKIAHVLYRSLRGCLKSRLRVQIILRDGNYLQHRQALRYRSDRCSLGADRADVAGSSARWPTTHNQHPRCVKRNLLSTKNRLPMAVASPGVSGVEHGLSLLPGLEERWCVGLPPAFNVRESS
jgi:hypothetical protein